MGEATNLPNVIIPSAVKVSPEIEVDFGPIPPCLVPIGGKVVAERIVEQYPADYHFYIALSERKELVEEHFEFFPNERVHLVDVGKTISIGNTVDRVFHAFPSLVGESFVINFADTVLERLEANAADGDFIAVASTIESERWTLIRETNGKITDISDKEFQFDTSGWLTLLGVWGVGDADRYLNCLRSLSPDTNRGAFYEAMLQYYNGLVSPPHFVDCPEFIDCGHADNYYSARRRMINARYFNLLKVNEETGTIRKTSQNKEKLVDEIRWIQAIPKELRSYTPSIFDYSKDPLNPFLEMEFYSYPSLDEAFVSARFDFDSWEKLFDKLFGLIRKGSSYAVKQSDLELDLREMYIDKTRTRIEAIDLEVLRADLVVNDHPVRGLDSVNSRLRASLDAVGALSADTFQVIHGDLCFGNILYDSKHGLIKLVDPRGRFGRFDIYGDVHYDLAKLSHSVLGLYDFIMSSRVKVWHEGVGYRLEFKATPYHATVGQIFEKHLARAGFDLARVRLLEALLFISMIPLHRDDPERQLAMGLRGLTLFEEYGVQK